MEGQPAMQIGNECGGAFDVSTRSSRRFEKNIKETKTAPAAARRREHGLGRYVQGREGRARGEARPEISAPRGGHHLDLGRLRLNTWSKSDFSIAETTWPTYLYISLYRYKGRFAVAG